MAPPDSPTTASPLEQKTALLIAVLHVVAMVAAPALLWNATEDVRSRLFLWCAIEACLAGVALISWWHAKRDSISGFVRWSLVESAGTVATFAALVWLGPDLAGSTPSKHVLLLALVSVTALSSVNSSHLTRRVPFFIPLVVVLVISYSAAFARHGEWILVAFSAVWCAALATFTQIGRRGLHELVEQRRASERDARHDDLTGLLARAAFFELVDELGIREEQAPTHVLMLCDLDGFKAVNDTYGHAIGDGVLTAIAKRIDLFLPATAYLGRMGGDEFAAVFPVAPDAVEPTIERMLDAVGKPVRVQDRELYVAASAGWTWIRPGTTAAELLMEADAAMYQSKNSETSRSSGFSPKLRENLDQELELRQRFRGAIRRGEIEFWLQPVVRNSDRMPIAIELLARWPHSPEIGPQEFSRVADETGLAVELDRMALRAACRVLADWHNDPLLQTLTVKTNVSPTHLHNDGLVRSVQEIVPWQLRARLGVEFTESRLIPAATRNHAQLKDLIAMGIVVSIDDFGSGYSSLAYLRDLPMSEIKIDRSFITQLDTDRINRGFVRAIVDIAQTLGLPTVAEGIETEEEQRAAAELGVTATQGFLLGQPVPITYGPTLLRSLEKASQRRAQAGNSTVRSDANAGISQD